jgi:hypothetical protein
MGRRQDAALSGSNQSAQEEDSGGGEILAMMDFLINISFKMG